VVGAAPAALDTLNELAVALNNDASYATTITNALSLKAPLASPTFTGTVGGITASMVGLGNVNNTSDANKPVSTAQQTALDLKANLASPTFTGTVSGITATMVGLGSVSNTSDADKPVSTAQQTALNLKANLASPTFTGTVSGITATMVGLGSVNNTSDADKPVSTAQQTALALKANLASPAFTGTVLLPAGSTTSAPLKLATGTSLTTPVFGSVEFDGTNLFLTNNSASPTRKTLAFTDAPTLTGVPLAPTAAAGTNTGQIATTQFVQSAIQAVVGAAPAALDTLNELAVALNNDASYATTITNALSLKAPLASPTFTGITTGTFSGPLTGNVTGNVSGSATSFSGALAGEVTGTQSATAISNATVTGKALTGYVSGAGTISATDTILTAINKLNGNDGLKANLASPTFTGTVALPAGSTTAAPLRLTAGTNLTTATLGSVEFDGNNLYLTTNSASPTRKTIAFTDSVSSSVPMANLTTAPVVPVLAWGDNSDGQTSMPTLANVAAVAAGQSHSLILLDAGTVVARGDNSNGQVTVPAGLTGVTEIAAGTSHNLVRKSDGTLVAWGANSYGQTTIPSGITTATRVAAGEKHSLALLANGSVRAWGDNTFGQTTLPASLTGAVITAIAAGYDHCLALKSDGTVIAWGRDNVGQVTLPSGLVNVVAIAAGAYHSLALKNDGTVTAWGWDIGGQATVPAGLSGVAKLAGGYAFSMVLKTNGTLVLWGDNSDGQITDPATATQQVTHIAAGASHALALRADAVPVQLAQLDSAGRLGIGRTPTTYALEVNGNAWKSTAGAWLSNSDRRIKTDIESISGALEKLDQVRLVDFRYTKDYLAAHPEIENRRYPNVIAQEFQKVFPEDVKGSGQRLPDGSEILQVDTYPLTIYSAAAIQELHRENQQQREKIASLEERLRKIEEGLKNK
jgi:hypothetical protein